MHSLTNKLVLLGITGGVAAYKAAELARLLRRAGAEVRVVMTDAACGFIAPLTLQALSGHPVHTELDADAESAMGHIALARWADIIVIAPASANCLAQLAHGLAPDLLSALCLATSSPLHLAPAMNREMWQNPATQTNVVTLTGRGVVLHGPADGQQACGETGPGRMLEPEQIVSGLARQFDSQALAGLQLMITAGPTREPLDPVRYLGNRSSGRMGYALADAAEEMGARVSLISGPVSLSPPERATVVRISTAEEMYAAVMENVGSTDIFIATAAVADFRSAQISSEKIKKESGCLLLTLEQTPDILAAVAAREDAPFTVGFAAETSALRERALEKLRGKGLDLIAANRVGPGEGIGTEDNTLSLFWPDGECELEKMPKPRLAREMLELVAQHYHAQ